MKPVQYAHRCNQFLLAILMALAFAPILTAAGPPQTRTRAAQPDIREIFLSLPIPKADLKSFKWLR